MAHDIDVVWNEHAEKALHEEFVGPDNLRKFIEKSLRFWSVEGSSRHGSFMPELIPPGNDKGLYLARLEAIPPFIIYFQKQGMTITIWRLRRGTINRDGRD